jgi:hypothetical protein
MSALLAYIPFVYPIQIFHDWWYLLLLPMAFGISVIYKALRDPTLEHYWRQVTIMTVQIVTGMIALAIVLVILVQVIVPNLPAE